MEKPLQIQDIIMVGMETKRGGYIADLPHLLQALIYVPHHPTSTLDNGRITI